ncbi:electron transfer flavoprotein subunit alpha/FixB family protein [Ruminococcus flavefaciens]|uniref:electron transfer flavoprotein subunit alpha/FixB family protein n=1 Tax=Ruminococcus flavefaciens TaxID=1265 RepID=UPI00048EB729|nr:electron transfer flavoprotein subunit alpha/FixB family protein [Ruminococcus flavefaciens]
MSREIMVVNDSFTNCSDANFYGRISKASELSEESNCTVTAVCIGNFNDELKNVFEYGADKVLLCKYDGCSHTDFCRIADKIIAESRPKMIIFPGSELGRRCAASMSVKHEMGLTAECIDIEWNGEAFIYKRAAINSSAIVQIKCVNCETESCTVKDGVFLPNKVDTPKAENIELFDSSGADLELTDDIEVISCEKKEKSVSTFSKIAFGFGRGASDKETLDTIYENAAFFDAQVFGTRAVVEDELIDKEHQVGQSGISISPDVYVALGISGACQHVVGIKNAKKVIAVNQDENAPIFDYADYAVVGDAKEITKEIKKIIEYQKQ